MLSLQTNLIEIKRLAAEKEAENDQFRLFLNQQDGEQLDSVVLQLNEAISAEIDCTLCGNCCRSLMINVTDEETLLLAAHLDTNQETVMQKYIEQSQQGQLIINSIPCDFLDATICSIYEHRFTECREFPHLHKPHFKSRLFGIMMYYAMCPIIFNVVEKLKEVVGFERTNE